jgi:hypothetical protein
VIHGEVQADITHALIELYVVKEALTEEVHVHTPKIQSLLDEFSLVFIAHTGYLLSGHMINTFH